MRVMRPGREADHSSPFGAEISNKWRCTPTPSIYLHGVARKSFILFYLLTRLLCFRPARDETARVVFVSPPPLPFASLKIHYSPVIRLFLFSYGAYWLINVSIIIIIPTYAQISSVKLILK